jgi:hypothetical protein
MISERIKRMKSLKRFALVFPLAIIVSTCVAADFIILPVFEQQVRSIGVGFASIDNRYYAAYTPDSHTDVHFMFSTDGVNFSETAKTPTDGYGGASIAAYNGHLYLAWQGGDNNHTLGLVEVILDPTTHKPTGVGPKVQSIQSSGNFPALVSTQAGLFITYLGNGNGHPVIARVKLP